MIADMGVGVGNLLVGLCCVTSFAVTIPLLAYMALKLWRKDWGLIRGRIGTMALVALITFLIVVQMQTYYESGLYQDVSESRKPDFRYYNTNATIEIKRVYLRDPYYRAWDGLFMGELGVVVYITEVGPTVRLMTMRSVDGSSWSGPYPMLLLEDSSYGLSWSYSCDLHVEKGRLVCDYSFCTKDSGTARYEWRTDTTDGMNWSIPRQVTDHAQDPSEEGFELPKSLMDFAWTDIDVSDVIRTSGGGVLVAVECQMGWGDCPDLLGTFFALEDGRGEWTDLVRVPAGCSWHGAVKLHEVSPGRYMVVDLEPRDDLNDTLLYTFFTEEAMKNVATPGSGW